MLGAEITVMSEKRQEPLVHCNLPGESCISQLYMKNKLYKYNITNVINIMGKKFTQNMKECRSQWS